MRRLLVILALAIGAAPTVSGCDLLGMPSTDDEDFGQPIATYTSGRATLVIDGRTIVLDQVSAGPHLYRDMGADVYWFNEEGWGLRLTSYGDGWMAGSDITIDRVQTTYWSAPGYGDCRLKVERLDATGAQGSASCDGLRWVDRLRGGSWRADEPYVEGEPAFDAEVTFEAEPAGPPPT